MSKKPTGKALTAGHAARTVQAMDRLAPTIAKARVGDSLESFVSGIGTERDKMASVGWVLRLLNDAEIMNAYRGDWIAAKAIDIPAFDSTREWRSWQASADEITKIEDAERNLKLQQKANEAIVKARAFGGSLLIMGVAVGNSIDPLLPEQVKEGDLQFLHVVGKHEIGNGQPIRDLASPWFGEPEYYQYTNANGEHLMIHPSRCVKFEGVKRIDMQTHIQMNWGDSVLQRIQDAVLATGTVANAIGQLVLESKMDVIGIPELSERMSDPEYEGLVKDRFALANVVKGLYHMLLIDKEEEWHRHNASFSGLDSIMNSYLVLAAGAADIPVTRFIGQSPAGLNATGESDMRNYYDRLKNDQSLNIGPALARLDEIMLRSALGDRDEEIFYEWNPLWQMTAKEKADIAVQKSTVFKADLDSGLFPDIVMMAARANQLIEDGTYPGFEQILDDFEAEIEEHINKPDEPMVAPPGANENDPNNTGKPRAPGEEEAEMEEGEPEAVARDAMFQRLRVTKRGRYDRRNLRWNAKKTKDGRSLLMDARPRTLYMRRDVLNGAEILKWAKEQGFNSLVDPKTMHVTIAYSKEPVDWIRIGSESYGEDENGHINIRPGGPRVLEQFGEAVVLCFANEYLAYRHMRIRDMGASWDHEDFNPHITLSWNPFDGILNDVQPYQGRIVLGQEVFEEIDPNWELKVREKGI